MSHLHLDRILQTRIVAVIRADDGARLVEAAQALVRGGVDVLEVTFTVPKPLQVIEQVTDALGDAALIGAGTVLDAETARSAMLAGAQFIVSPSTDLDVIELCRRHGKLVMPGALTPTEVVTAWQAGADVVKIFPADSVGPAYLKGLRGPLPHIRLMPTGGVDLSNVADFLTAGACAVGVGGSLVKKSLIDQGRFDELEALARQFVDAAQSAG